jgi:ankyrin repeat protein
MRCVLPFVVLCAVAVGACGSGVPVSPLATAARAGDVAEIDRLLAGGADINAGSGVNDWPPIIHAIHTQQMAALAHLLERGAALDDQVLARALNVAQGSGDEAAVRPILDAHRPRTTVSRVP